MGVQGGIRKVNTAQKKLMSYTTDPDRHLEECFSEQQT